jgi:hypothetical protein
MPVVVRELIIRARVEEINSSDSPGAASPSTGDTGTTNQEDIIAICVEKVMEALELKNER